MNKIEITSVTVDSYRTSEAFKSLRTNLQFSGSEIKCVAITSCQPNEGKSLISVEIAKSLSELNKKVVVIDTDMRKSVMTVRYKTDIKNPLGLSQFLTNQASFEEVILSTQFEGLDMILSGMYPPNPVELLYTDKFKELLAKCREKYDYIIVDTPPLGSVIDAAVIAPNCDGAVLVISVGKIKYRLASTVKKQLEKANCKILGAVMNYTDSEGLSGRQFADKYYRAEYGDSEGKKKLFGRKKKTENTEESEENK